ncbi:DUF6118 family protein [Sphingobium indicum]|nr:DUF6118 family protein [Sphingobium indicum]
MRGGNPNGWQVIVDAADLARENGDTLAACQRSATKMNEPVRCTIRIRKR